MEHHCAQCGGVLLRGAGDGSGQGRCQEHFMVEGFEHLGVACSRSCGNLLIEMKTSTDKFDSGRGDFKDPYDYFVNCIQTNNLEEVERLVRQYSPRTLPVEHCRTKEMWRLLVVQNRGDPYRFIGKGRVALEECAKYFSIAEVMRERLFLGDKEKEILDAASAKMAKDGVDIIEIPNLGDKLFLENNGKSLNPHYMSVLDSLIWNGVFPMIFGNREYARKLEDIVFRRYNDRTFRFWYNDDINWFVYSLASEPWYMFTVASARTEAARTVTSFPLLILDPTSLYRESRRPRTDMSMFRSANSKMLKEKSDDFFPVTRFAAGMSRSLFHENTAPILDAGGNPKSYCGTFYYLEPESTCFLYLKNPLIVRNKTKAYLFLKEKYGEPLGVDERETITLIEKWENSDLFTFPEYWMSAEQRRGLNIGLQLDRDFYSADKLKLYAAEDILDQFICTEAYADGYDGIILTHMVGSRQVVGEVLDTRPRAESFQNLYFMQ